MLIQNKMKLTKLEIIILTLFNKKYFQENNASSLTLKKNINNNKIMSIKSNIVTLKSWLSEKVKKSYTTKEQIAFVSIERITEQKVVIKKNVA
jgi:hypothetical protein